MTLACLPFTAKTALLFCTQSFPILFLVKTQSSLAIENVRATGTKAGAEEEKKSSTNKGRTG